MNSFQSLIPQQSKSSNSNPFASLIPSNPTPKETPTPALPDRLASDWQKRGSNVASIISNPNEGNAVSRGLKVAGQAFGGVADVVTEGLKSFGSLFGGGKPPTPEQVAQQKKNEAIITRKELPGPVESLANTDLFKGAVKGDTRKLENTLGAAEGAGTVASVIAGTDVVPETGITKVSEVPGAVKNTVSDFISDTKKLDTKIGDIRGNVSADKDTLALQEKIAPKPTVKQARLAERQGRLVKGKNETIFNKSTADTILPSDKEISAVKTIQKNIPGAAKMDEPTLYTALEKKTGEIAENLKPEMQKTPIKPETIDKINSDLKTLQKKQLENADVVYKSNGTTAPDPNVLKRQQRFESFLKESGSENMDDIWNTRKNYDASVPDNVKKANINSPESLQAQRQEWLDNRSILNDAINDTKNGLGETSETAFDEMSDMYAARENILSKAKVNTTIKPSKLNQFFGSGKGKITKKLIGGALTGIGVGGGYEVGKKILGE